jgi:hypothetical protein
MFCSDWFINTGDPIGRGENLILICCESWPYFLYFISDELHLSWAKYQYGSAYMQHFLKREKNLK